MKMYSYLRTSLMTAALGVPLAAMPVQQAQAAVFVSVNVAPPVLPVYAQPVCPAPGYIWTPGYWAYGPEGYYWVPGVWVEPPNAGLLWTPAWWGFENGGYLFHAGYWGPHVGFYGGINYGFGYSGVGFFGGEWRGGSFFYNRSVSNVNVVNVTNVYNRTVIVNNHTTVAYNGGPGGIGARPTAQEATFSRENHIAPTANQISHQNFAAQDRTQFASFNHGRPGVPAAASVNSFRANPANAAFAARPTPNQREGNQDQRVANGLRSGQMTSGEAARATGTQSRIDQQVHADRAANGGTLTPGERQQVHREQNAASRQIYNDNHNGNTIAPNAIDNREANQQQRTADGLRSGQMTSGEAARANTRQAGVDQQVHAERTANGGGLNRGERQQVNREQNANSRQVLRENHNGRERH
ncbi:MAG: YXWGXW repeat-containing protein [Rhodospirillales bacterium]|nr:YXWGXW repeat-containing protein [Acetobacter sp.]